MATLLDYDWSVRTCDKHTDEKTQTKMNYMDYNYCYQTQGGFGTFWQFMIRLLQKRNQLVKSNASYLPF